eukprot:TRINITY_DN54906_c0_g1_i1.p1 TRINITY_DN54906_c0_g1~~TRINITY_DN54906_c0_g1_i1.p1  ORF type:complete len:112 (+),score=21.21 TRINITY_DN54906_c0_g1_i1:199-534(+)
MLEDSEGDEEQKHVEGRKRTVDETGTVEEQPGRAPPMSERFAGVVDSENWLEKFAVPEIFEGEQMNERQMDEDSEDKMSLRRFQTFQEVDENKVPENAKVVGSTLVVVQKP